MEVLNSSKDFSMAVCHLGVEVIVGLGSEVALVWMRERWLLMECNLCEANGIWCCSSERSQEIYVLRNFVHV